MVGFAVNILPLSPAYLPKNKGDDGPLGREVDSSCERGTDCRPGLERVIYLLAECPPSLAAGQGQSVIYKAVTSLALPHSSLQVGTVVICIEGLE